MVNPTRPVPPFNGKWGTTYRPQQPEPWPKKGNWHKWFAWYPVKVNSKLKWLVKVYRRPTFHYDSDYTQGGLYSQWKYGTLFDILKD